MRRGRTILSHLSLALQHLANAAEVTMAKADSTLRTSRAVPHPSTNRALSSSTAEVARDLVHSTRYGRQLTLCGGSPLGSAAKPTTNLKYFSARRCCGIGT